MNGKMSVFTRLIGLIKDYKTELAIASIGLVLMNVIFLARAFRETTTVDPAAAGQFGDFVGGYVGTLFSLVSILLLFRTLRNQRVASLQQSFESKYFVLLKLHRDNVAELELGSATGRKFFVLMLRELRCALHILQNDADVQKHHLTQRELLSIAYCCVFFGVGPNSSRVLRMSLSGFNLELVDAVLAKLDSTITKMAVQRERNFTFIPFEGHQSRLGHYYRHLYQTVRYVDQQDIDIDKAQYMRTIRAQLSTHEQAMLLLNSLTPMGKPWWHANLIVPYKLVKNLPRDFFDAKLELDMGTLFKPGYFEWEEMTADVYA